MFKRKQIDRSDGGGGCSTISQWICDQNGLSPLCRIYYYVCMVLPWCMVSPSVYPVIFYPMCMQYTCTTDLVNLLISRERLYVELCARHRHPFIIIWLPNSWKMFLQRLSVWSRQMIITLNHRFLSFLVNMTIVYGSYQGCYIIFLCETWPFVCWIIGYTRYADRRRFFQHIIYTVVSIYIVSIII